MSPYELLQEIYYPDKWKMMVCCIFLNCTTRKQVDKIRDEFFERWPTPESISEKDRDAIRELITPLGLKDRRTNTIIKFSHEFINKNWKNPIELSGIGKYGQDSWDIFVNNKVIENPSDHVLKKYMLWKIKA